MTEELTHPEASEHAEAEEEEEGGLGWSDVAFILFIGAMLLLNVFGLFREIFGIDTAIILTLVGGYRIFWDSISRLLRGKIGGDLAVTIAAFAALAIGEYVAAAEVILIMLVGGALEEFAVEKTRGAIRKLMTLTPPVATVRRGGQEQQIPVEAVVPGDTVIVRPGERIPVDGTVREGRSAVDQSALTGESMPVDKEPGAPVFTGTFNTLGMLEITAERVGADTTLAQVIRLVEEAEERKAPIERLADRWSTYFVPILLAAAGAVLLLTGQVTRMIAALIVACPCALILATPTAIAAGIGRLARNGTLLKGGAYLEEIGRVDCVVFDKTGTLTEGNARVAAVLPCDGHHPDDVLRLAATAEQGASHPIAAAILAAWDEATNDQRRTTNDDRPTTNDQRPLTAGQQPEGDQHGRGSSFVVGRLSSPSTALPSLEHFHFDPGFGIEARVEGCAIYVGNRALLERHGIALDEAARAALAENEAAGRTVVLVGTEGERQKAEDGGAEGVGPVPGRQKAEGKESLPGRLLPSTFCLLPSDAPSCCVGMIALEDPLRADAPAAVAALKALGIRRTVMLTGDSATVARGVGARLALDEVAAELFPAAKVERVRQLQADGYRVAMLGDGINDAPSLVTANVGIAMGKGGTDIAMEAADIVFMTDELMKLPDAIVAGRLVLRTIRQNILWFAILLNSAGVLGAAFGLVTPIMAAVGHQIASLCVVCNSLRLLWGRRTPSGFRISDFGFRISESRMPSILRRSSQAVADWFAARKSEIRNPKSEIQRALAFVRSQRRTLTRGAVVALALGWLLSGVYTVRAGQVGVVQRFGKLVAGDVPPGLHYRLPWPIERLAKVDVATVRRLEFGFRSPTPARIKDYRSRITRFFNPKSEIRNPKSQTDEPASYEWNTPHQAGFQRRQDESLMLTGDEYLVEVNAAVQYRVARPADFLFTVAGPEALLHHAAETAIREAVGRETLEAVLTSGRARLEQEIRESAQARVNQCACGIEVVAVRLQDVHPPQEVVGAFRDVASALEEKGRRINVAEAERNARVPAARAEAARNLIAAGGYTVKRIREASGDAARFTAMADANRAGPQTTRIRLHLETMEQVLAGPRKFIVDPRQGGRRQIYLIDGQTLAPVPGGAGAPIPGLSVPASPAPPGDGGSGQANGEAAGNQSSSPSPTENPEEH